MSFKISSGFNSYTCEVDFFYDSVSNTLHILDLDGDVSLTNCVENVVENLRERADFKPNSYIFLYDTYGDIAQFDGGFKHISPDHKDVYPVFRDYWK
ncbi:hypothetical protein LC065_20250 (plasmid) [Halobacillus litoralis]|uniref:hypothetical protein n=1 Tax=Halobacillus litoralis TaxID=45668 RepID=UPI001CFE530C|nr:hypothetical protein [Halobacillus litoralis]WLR49578.1 hypothetical protein LC065_20250 [Halobacillus litoralis]